MSSNVAFLGLGAMGFGMATALLKKGHPVTGYDVWAPTLERFVAAGGQASSSPRETVKDAKYIVFMVATAAQVQSALFDGENAAIHDIGRGAALVLCSTGPPEYVPNIRTLLDEKYGRKDVQVVDAPVSGGTIRAAAGTLTILASGPESALEAAKPVLDDMAGPNLYIIPGGLGAGTKVKMVHQVLAGIHIVMTSEAMGFVAALGLNTKAAFEELKSGEATSFMFENRVPHMLVKDEKVYSALNIIAKDIGIVTAGGRAVKFPLFLASATEQILAIGVRSGLGPIDDAALTRVYIPQEPTLVLELASSPSTLQANDSKLRLVKQAMTAVHLVAAAEALSLGAAVGLDTAKLFEIIATAAGTSAMFVDRGPQMLKRQFTSNKTIDNVIAELNETILEANNIKYPLHLAATALQLLQQARLRGLGSEPDAAVCKLWDASGLNS